MTTPIVATSLRFGRFQLQARERRLLIDGRATRLGARAFDLLLALAERPGRLVDKATLIELVWPGLVVQENNLAAQMSALRKLLGEEVIATIPGRGYRFVARLEGSAAPQAEPSAACGPTLRTNLPADLPLLLGRSDDLAELGALIDRHRLVSVIGAGGVGKSLLTQHVLAARRAAYAHGVCWIELGGLIDASALPGAVAAALGVHGGHGEALAALVSAVSSLTMLIALDNAEHLLADVATLCGALHDAAPGLRLVVTSQAPLRLATEQVFRIEPLAVPDLASTAADALRFGAVALFAERARAIDRRFQVSDVNAAAVIDTCRAVDGLPLAIELAAARAPLLGLPRLLASMQDRFALLTQSRNRSAPERQRTLRAALEWSCELLAPREQQVFRRLGIVAGSASLTLIQQVLVEPEGGEFDAWAVLDALDTLVDRSLVAVSIPGADDEARYRLLETPRAYALERLEEAGEREALQRRHALAVAAMFDAAYDEYFSGHTGVDEWLQRLERDLDNARDALRWARTAGATSVELRIGTTMLRALPPSLHVERMALADACEAGMAPALPEPLQLKAWIELSCVLADSQKARARRAADQALALARRLDAQQPDRFALYHAVCRAASAAAQASDLPAARALLDESQRLEDPSWPAQRLLWGSEAAQWVARMSGDTAEALRCGRRLLAFKLAAYSEAIYAAREEARELNETAATTRAQSLARRSLDDATFQRLRAEGASMRDCQVDIVAFGADSEYGPTGQ
jgi:predicted ATPase/DNA-binding winged helix-turn-helix (wHTH) protein